MKRPLPGKNTVLCAALLLAQVVVAPAAPNMLQPTYKDVAYGPHERQKLNFWQAKSDRPTPLLVQIHGGGWINGKKTEAVNAQVLADGASYCSINYRLAATDILPAPVHDAARAIQFLRTKAKEWNIYPDKIVVTGGSAGAASSLWLAFHDDLRDPDNPDPILRQSSRVAGAIAMSGQTTLDPFVIEERIGTAGTSHPMVWQTVGAKSPEDLKTNWSRFKNLSLEFSALSHVTKDDPPVFLKYGKFLPVPVEKGKGDGIHHAAFGIMLKDKCDQVGTECHLEIQGRDKPELTSDEFLKRIFAK